MNRSLLSNFLAAILAHGLGASHATPSSHIGSRRILPILHRIHHLTGGYVADQLRERDRITGAREALSCHQRGR
jgi:hypothetical protein